MHLVHAKCGSILEIILKDRFLLVGRNFGIASGALSRVTMQLVDSPSSYTLKYKCPKCGDTELDDSILIECSLCGEARSVTTCVTTNYIPVLCESCNKYCKDAAKGKLEDIPVNILDALRALTVPERAKRQAITEVLSNFHM
jgi:hypothetical protein